MKFPNLVCPHPRCLCCFESLEWLCQPGGWNGEILLFPRDPVTSLFAVKVHRPITRSKGRQSLLYRLLVACPHSWGRRRRDGEAGRQVRVKARALCWRRGRRKFLSSEERESGRWPHVASVCHEFGWKS